MAARLSNPAFLLILSALMAFTSLSTDIYLPAMPKMEKALGGSAELTITGFLIGFAVAQLFWGAVSDRIGRKIPLFAGMVLFVIGSAGCALSDTMGQVVFWRIVQAAGACVAPMLSRAMIRDLYGSREAAQMLSTLTIIMAAAPIAGPFVGGALLKAGDWHSIFWLLALIGAVMFAAVFRLPETLPQEKRGKALAGSALAHYGRLLNNRKFMRYTLAVTAFYVAAYAFIAGSPKVYLDFYGVDPAHYGFLFGANIIGVMVVSFANRTLVGRCALPDLLFFATLAATGCAAALALCVLTGWGGIWGIALPVFGIFSTNGIIAATANAAALGSVPPQVSGSAAALLGSLQYGSGIVSSLLLAAFSDGTPVAMGLIIAVFVAVSFAFARRIRAAV